MEQTQDSIRKSIKFIHSENTQTMNNLVTQSSAIQFFNWITNYWIGEHFVTLLIHFVKDSFYFISTFLQYNNSNQINFRNHLTLTQRVWVCGGCVCGRARVHVRALTNSKTYTSTHSLNHTGSLNHSLQAA